VTGSCIRSGEESSAKATCALRALAVYEAHRLLRSSSGMEDGCRSLVVAVVHEQDLGGVVG
jgi:hypothetical protein